MVPSPRRAGSGRLSQAASGMVVILVSLVCLLAPCVAGPGGSSPANKGIEDNQHARRRRANAGNEPHGTDKIKKNR